GPAGRGLGRGRRAVGAGAGGRCESLKMSPGAPGAMLIFLLQPHFLMALIWSKRHGNVNYEVRSAGNTRRLYSNGVFHSSYNPSRAITGGVWDLLMMPAFLYPPGAIRRVLLLGVGGGTVIRQLQAFVRPREIVAVDLDPVHLDVARRFFGVRGEDARLVHADAREWLDADDSRYDLVIDDLFGERDGEPVRAVTADAAWCR